MKTLLLIMVWKDKQSKNRVEKVEKVIYKKIKLMIILMLHSKMLAIILVLLHQTLKLKSKILLYLITKRCQVLMLNNEHLCLKNKFFIFEYILFLLKLKSAYIIMIF